MVSWGPGIAMSTVWPVSPLISRTLAVYVGRPLENQATHLSNTPTPHALLGACGNRVGERGLGRWPRQEPE